jgi:hypothetical protein
MSSPFYKALRRGLYLSSWALLFCTCCISASYAQSDASSAESGEQRQLASKIETLTKSLEQTQVELAESRTEIQQLRATLKEVLKRMDTLAPAASGSAPSDAAPVAEAQPNAQPVAPEETHGPAPVSQDDWEILNARVEEQRQTKVESASKYRLKLSGIALFNAFANTGTVDNLDVPTQALSKTPGYSDGSVGATVRQSMLGLTGIGPVVFGARTVADLQVDFFGGLPNSYGSTSSGIAEIRLARARFDWKNTSLIAGLDYPFFSPNLPTTYMSVVVPAFASSGSLWNWTPTIRVERRFDGSLSPFKVEVGLLDPSAYATYNAASNLRTSTPTESSRQPTYAIRFSANTKSEDHPASIGFSGVYSPQRFFGGYTVGGWGSVLDWKFPLLPRTELSGQFFTGRGLDGFGGAPLSPLRPSSAIYYNVVTAPELATLGVIGGWSQLKFKVDNRNEFNVAAGTGGRNSFGLRTSAQGDAFLLTVPARNQTIFANYIFRPRSDLLFSVEYRRLRTYQVDGAPDSAGQFGLALGFLF